MFFISYVDATVKKIKANTANLLTLVNLGLGGFAILYTINDVLKLSLLLIFLAALADRFDGMVARKFNIESELGKQLDSMSDIISFGVAPALLLYKGILFELGAPGAFFIVLYIGCGAFRLARFNISDNCGFFNGLPITAAGCILTLSYLWKDFMPAYYYMFLLMILSFCMIASFKIRKM